MANHYFFTGFPGFISINLIKQLIKGNSDVGKISLLVLPTMKTKAQEELTQLREELNMGESGPKFELILGDITKPNLNIETETNKQLIDSVRYVFHLAAIYDLAVPKKLAYEVNVKGTANVNQWVKSLKNLKRYVYFSTAYVAGKRQGPILETELDKKQEFKNHYEHTKYEAEVLVEQLKESVPLTIIRPGVVVGHSNSGETTKFDGPYFLLNFFDRLRFSPIIPYLGKGEAEGNFVPINYIIDATIHLSHSDKGIGKTYHLTDSNPYQMKDIYRMMLERLLNRKPLGTIPLLFAKVFLSFSIIRKWLKVEKEALDYFTFKSEFDVTHSKLDLEGSGIACPDFKNVIDAIVPYYEQHKHDEQKHIEIR